MKLKSLSIILFFWTQSLICQESVNASGGVGAGTGSVHYSVGQLIVSIQDTSNGAILHGVQQSYEVLTLSNPELQTIKLQAKTYPNPTKGKIILSLTDNQLTELSYTVYDINGRTVNKGIVNSKETAINMKPFAVGIYYLKVHQNTKQLKVFKIIKN